MIAAAETRTAPGVHGARPPAARDIVAVSHLTKTFGSFTALDDVSFRLQPDKIYGLLGRNGAGKTTLMQLLTGQDFAQPGTVQVFGQNPVENRRVLEDICFIKESQKYPEGFKAKHVMKSAPWFFRNWDQAFADRLLDDFRVPLGRDMKKLSRGQLSAVGVIVGLASRAPITLFDEPYLGLDAVARQIFYDRLLEDFAVHPRTVILSTHLIDEVSNLLEHVIVIDRGRILIDSDAEDVRGTASTVVGKRSDVDAFTEHKDILHRDQIGGLASVTITGQLSPTERQEATELGLELAPVSLQQLIVRLTEADAADAGAFASTAAQTSSKGEL